MGSTAAQTVVPSSMARPAPISLRLPATTQMLVEQWASARRIPRNAAYVELIQRGLSGIDLAGAIPARQAKGAPPSPPRADREPKPAKPFTSRLKGQWKAP